MGWFILGGILAVGTLFWSTLNIVGLLAHEEYPTTEETFAATSVRSLDVATDNGSITVIADEPGEAKSDAGGIVVSTEVGEGLRPTKVSQRVVDGVLELRGTCPGLNSPWCHVDFTIRLPADRPVHVDADNGSVVVEGVSAPVDVDNDNGRIDLVRVSGDISVTNDNGRIAGTALTAATVRSDNDNGSIELSFTTAPSLVLATNDNGSITVAVPDDRESYRVDIRTDNGSSDNGVRTDPASDRVIDLSTSNGSVRLRPSD
ncbi:MAG: hypothetical protein ABIP17_07270 [Ilumatobacteraceae bacterium]